MVAWVLENFERGCDPTSIFKTMLDSGWSWRDVHSFMESAENKRNSRPPDSWTPSPQKILLSKQSKPCARISLLLRDPCIALIENFATPEEAAALIRLGKAKLARSMTVANDPAIGSETNPDRSSFGAQLPEEANPLICEIRNRASLLFGCPRERMEGLQILRYLPSEQYKPHHDWFDPASPGGKIQLGRGGQRVGTLILYLNDCQEGGFTTFPQLGIESAPIAGNAIFFSYATDSNMQGDSRLLHSGAPVVQGEKWICTFWMRQGAFD